MATVSASEELFVKKCEIRLLSRFCEETQKQSLNVVSSAEELSLINCEVRLLSRFCLGFRVLFFFGCRCFLGFGFPVFKMLGSRVRVLGFRVLENFRVCDVGFCGSGFVGIVVEQKRKVNDIRYSIPCFMSFRNDA
jgi:hypothetical protein